MAWVDREADADGLIWYRPHHRGGIRNQVWKDSNDSYRFADGRIAEPPIAAVEVQGYVLAARWGWAAVLDALGEESEADRQRAAARRLAATIEALMMSSFVLLVHIPGVAQAPHDRMQLTMFGMASLLTLAAWLIASWPVLKRDAVD